MRSHPYYTYVLKHSRAEEMRSVRRRTLKLINALHADGAEKASFLSMWRMACAYFNAQCEAAMEVRARSRSSLAGEYNAPCASEPVDLEDTMTIHHPQAADSIAVGDRVAWAPPNGVYASGACPIDRFSVPLITSSCRGWSPASLRGCSLKASTAYAVDKAIKHFLQTMLYIEMLMTFG